MYENLLGWLPVRKLFGRPRPPTSSQALPLLFVVEGPHDVEFLRRISRLLHMQYPALPDLAALEAREKLVFLPVGGSGPRHRPTELTRLGSHQVHLFDREDEPETSRREEFAHRLNYEPNCYAFVTGKRSLENYLHSDVVTEVARVDVLFGDHEPVADLVAQRLFEAKPRNITWQLLPYRSRKRLRDRAKCWLNTEAVDWMTIGHLEERDPDGEIQHWLATVAELLG